MKRLLSIGSILICFLTSCLYAYGDAFFSDNPYPDEDKSAVENVIANDANENGIPDTTDAGGWSAGAWGPSSEVTIVSGVASLSGEGYYTIDTESDDANDDLTRITGLVAGDEIIITAEHTDRTVTVKTGTYFHIVDDFILNNTRDRLTLQCIGSDVCVQKSRSNGGD